AVAPPLLVTPEVLDGSGEHDVLAVALGGVLQRHEFFDGPRASVGAGRSKVDACLDLRLGEYGVGPGRCLTVILDARLDDVDPRDGGRPAPCPSGAQAL